ncbi:MAG: MFS transporter [Kocuria rhizophila]|nr:MAG: MFS transporter [Kocuria rhizophila]
MSSPISAPEPLTPRERSKILWVLLVPLFMALVSVSIVNVALPAIQADLHASSSALQWVLTGFALAFGVLLVASGRAGDIFGRRKLFMAGIILFAVASLVCGLAPNTTVLNIGRVAQGLGSGLINPQSVGMIQQYFHGPARAKAFGMLGAVVGVAVAIGPAFGGFLIGALGDGAGWRATFLINVPTAAVALLLAALWLPRQKRKPGRVDMDPVGVVLFGLGILALLFPFVESRLGPLVWLSLLLGALLLFAWTRRIASFSYGSAMITVYFLGMTSVWVVLAMYVQQGLGRTALEAGMLSLPAALMSAVVAPLAGRGVLRFGRRVILVGIACAMTGLLTTIGVIYGVVHFDWNIAWLYLTLVLVGVGQGSVMPPNQTLSFSEVPLKFAGAAGGVMQTGQRVGTAVGTAVITAVAFGVLARSDWDTAFTASFLAIVGVLVIAFVIALLDHRRPKPPGPATGPLQQIPTE